MRQKYSIGPVWFLMFACAFFTSCVTQGKKVQQEELSQYVEPRIGTAHCPGSDAFRYGQAGSFYERAYRE